MKISVVIVTKDRVNFLKKCLSSLVFQTAEIDELVIIDNNSLDKTKKITELFAKSVEFPVRYVLEKSIGYPTVYNRGLKESSHSWVAFIDDDCVASSNWLNEIKKKISDNSKTSVILGSSKTIYKKNIFSLTILTLDLHWKLNGIVDGKIIDYEILDNKNICYNKKFLQKNKVRFNEKRTDYLSGAAEDCELGKQIEKLKGRAVYCDKAIVYHHDPVQWNQFWRRYFRSYAAYLSLAEQSLYISKRKKHYRLRMIIEKVLTESNPPFIQKISYYAFLTFVVILSIFLSKMMKHGKIRESFLKKFR